MKKTYLLTLALLFGETSSTMVRLGSSSNIQAGDRLYIMHQTFDDKAEKCKRPIDVLKDGPADINQILGTGKPYVDTTFDGPDAYSIFGDKGVQANGSGTFLKDIKDGVVQFKRWQDLPQYQSYTLFGPDDIPSFNEAK